MRNPKCPSGSLNSQFNKITVVPPEGIILPSETKTSRQREQEAKILLVDHKC